MSDSRPATAEPSGRDAPPAGGDNVSGARIILWLAIPCGLVYAALAALGDLRDSLGFYLVAYAFLVAAMLLAWRALRRGHGTARTVLIAALAFRIIAAVGDPALSDDVYRYVWDGRVQVHGFHPYAYSPLDPALETLRDDDWERINHPELRTIYPPVAELFFFLLAAVGAGPVGFKLALGLADFGVVLALGLLLRRLSLPRDRLVLYAWNPLAVMETAGSGHIEPVGVGLLILALVWLVGRRVVPSVIALAASVHVKLLPLVLIPGFLRRSRAAALGLLPLGLVLPVAVYAVAGPAVGSGLFDYAERWEYNAFIYAAVEAAMVRLDTAAFLKPALGALQDQWSGWSLPWDFLYRHVWPRDIARLLVGLVVCAVAIVPGLRAGRELSRQWLLVAGTVLLLSPTLHPWYLLWLLPFAAAHASWGWLVFGMTVPLAYISVNGDVPWVVKWIEYLPPLGVMAATAAYRFRRRRSGQAV